MAFSIAYFSGKGKQIQIPAGTWLAGMVVV
jgi:hypothetical protein